MSRPARAVVAVPLYENVVHLREALESLLAQDYDGTAIVLIDDSLSDEPGAMVRATVGKDPRVKYERNETRLGLVENWRCAFRRARELHPTLTYFAWGSDNDVWEPQWLSRLAAELDANRQAVLAYPFNDRISAAGDRLWAPWHFDTRDTRLSALRFARTLRRMVAGDMVYGLFRAEALQRCGIYRSVVMPDRLLLAELSVHGEFRQVPELLWHRRGGDRFSTARQRELLFVDGVPHSTHLPWWLAHAAALARAGKPATAAAYFVLAPSFQATRRAYYALGGSPRSDANRGGEGIPSSTSQGSHARSSWSE